MTPRGAAPLIAMRQAGFRPSGDVWVSYGDFPELDWWRWANTCNSPELVVLPTDPIERLDFRCLVGLRVVLFAAEWSARVGKLFELLTEYADEVVVMSPAFEGDIGWFWLKDHGRVEFDDRWRIDALADAKAAAVNAAFKGDQAAYQAARVREAQAQGSAPWQQ